MKKGGSCPKRRNGNWQNGQWNRCGREWPPSPSQMPSAPAVLMSVPWLITDLKALEVLTALEDPPVHYVQTKRIYIAFYGGSDASGSGFGSAIPTQ